MRTEICVIGECSVFIVLDGEDRYKARLYESESEASSAGEEIHESQHSHFSLRFLLARAEFARFADIERAVTVQRILAMYRFIFHNSANITTCLCDSCLFEYR